VETILLGAKVHQDCDARRRRRKKKEEEEF
jgi:hypothetical protein